MAKKRANKTVGPVFIIEKDGKAYFKNKLLNKVCRPSTVLKQPKYEGFCFEYDYMSNLTWFKRYVALIMVNNGPIKFVGMDADEFNALGGTPISINGAVVKNVTQIKKK